MVENIIFWKTFVEFLDLSLFPKKCQRKQAFTPWNSSKLFDSLWKSQGQKPRTMKVPYKFFLNIHGNSTSSLIDVWNFHMLFLQYPWKIHASKPTTPCLNFFWNKLIFFLEKCLIRANKVTCFGISIEGLLHVAQHMSSPVSLSSTDLAMI